MLQRQFFSYLKLPALAFAILSVSGCSESQPSGEAGGPEGGFEQSLPIVGVLKPSLTKVPVAQKFSGRVEASVMSEVRPQVSGIIQKRYFKEGSLVEAGSTLYSLNPETYRALYDSAQAAVARSQAILTNAEIKVKRNERLIKVKGVSQQLLDDARATVREAKANLLADKAALKSAEIDLARTEIKAPISGIIGRSVLTEGALVSANQTQVLATIQQLSPVYIDFTLPAQKALELKQSKDFSIVDMPVTLTLEEGRLYEQSGKIILSEFKVNRSSDSVVLRAEFPNPEHQLLPGMFARGTVTSAYYQDVMLIPATAVARTAQGMPYVLLLDKTGEVSFRPITVAGLHEQSWIVTGGVSPEDRVIVKGLQLVHPGAKAQAEADQKQG